MLTIAISQINLKVGDFNYNISRILEHYQHASTAKHPVDLVIYPEMTVCGYPPEDLVLLDAFANQAMDSIKQLALKTKNGPAMLVGGIYYNPETGKRYNSAFLLQDGVISARHDKYHRPNYGVFDEKRYFTGGNTPNIIPFKGHKLGILICEDCWQPTTTDLLIRHGAELMISLNASPFEYNKQDERKTIAKHIPVPFIYTNIVGGQDELVFDGHSFASNAHGDVIMQMPQFKEDFGIVSFDDHQLTCTTHQPDTTHCLEETIYQAICLGLKDYVSKNHFNGVVIGMSGGIDSALTAAIAVDSLGPEKVRLIMMPSPYTSNESLTDAKNCADYLGVTLESVNIIPMMESFNKELATLFSGTDVDTTEENMQSRIRGTILMAISNKFNLMVITTGNKSEMATGYATLYGDMCGGYNALKDVYKTQVFDLAKWRNTQNKVIPENIISKPPTAELKDNQKDEDSLPNYNDLDKILKMILEEKKSSQDIINASDFDPQTVKKIAHLIKISEYKRRQAPPGVKISRLAFGRDRRLPLVSGYNL